MVKSFKLTVNDREYIVEIGDLSESPLIVKVNGEAYRVEVEHEAPGPTPAPQPAPVAARPAPPEPKVAPPPAAPRAPVFPKPGAKVTPGAVCAPMPCKVLEIKVKEGDKVKTGDALFLIESMKMEITIPAATDGVVKAIRVAVGQTCTHAPHA